MEELKKMLLEVLRECKQPEFPPEPVPTRVAAKVLGVEQSTVINRMESGELDIGLVFRSKPTKRGQASRRSTYISPKKVIRADRVRMERRQAMKRRETEVTEEVEETTGAGVIAPIVATAAAAFTFWWLGKYSTICERDIVGTTITVWCAVVIRIMLWAEKEEAE